MKKAALLFLFCGAVAFTSYAQDQQQEASISATAEQSSEKKIELSSVPANVVAALNNTAYKAENVSEVYEVTEGTEKQYKFIVDAADGKRAVTFDAAGTMKSDKKQD